MKRDRLSHLSPQELLETKALADFYRNRVDPVEIPSFEKVWKEAEQQYKPQSLFESYSAKRKETEIPAFKIPMTPRPRASRNLSWQTLQIGFSVLAVGVCCFAVFLHLRANPMLGQIPSITSASYFTDSFFKELNTNPRLDPKKRLGKDEISADFLLDIKYDSDSLLEE